jgi:hypothetical protein
MPVKMARIVGLGWAFQGDVKKIPNGSSSGLDPGETAFADFSFRLRKSRK